MPTHYISKILISHHHFILAIRVASFNVKVNMLYSSCVAFLTLYIFLAHFINYAKYIHKGICYDGNFSTIDFNRLIVKC
jgi:hypothetical protein